jgi:hypothetical protein
MLSNLIHWKRSVQLSEKSIRQKTTLKVMTMRAGYTITPLSSMYDSENIDLVMHLSISGDHERIWVAWLRTVKRSFRRKLVVTAHNRLNQHHFFNVRLGRTLTMRTRNDATTFSLRRACDSGSARRWHSTKAWCRFEANTFAHSAPMIQDRS